MSLLTVIQDAMVRMNLPKPAVAFSNTDPTVQQMVSFAQDIGDELSERYFWRALNITATITGDGATTLWTIPADFGGLSPGFTFTSRDRPNFQLIGPVTNEQMNLLKALTFLNSPGGMNGILLLNNGIDALQLQGGGHLLLNTAQSSSGAMSYTVWRLIGPTFEFWPALDKGELVTYNYYSGNWIQPAVVNFATPARTIRYAADTDTCMIDERIQTSGVIWRWLASKGLDYAEEFRRYEDRLSRATGRQNTERVVSMSRERSIPDNWFPGIILDLR